MLNYLIFNGRCSRDLGVYISGSGAFNAPERDVETISVPGRSGDLILDNGRYKNIPVTYPAFIREEFRLLSGAARAWLLNPVGYRRLEDTYNPEFFRLARFVGPLDFDVRALQAGGEMSLLFDAKPQRYLKSGEFPILLTQAATIGNPTGFPALPLIKVYGQGAGRLQIGQEVLIFGSIEEYTVVDCDLQEAYKSATEPAGVRLDAFPVLGADPCDISWSGGITKIELIPRWWII